MAGNAKSAGLYRDVPALASKSQDVDSRDEKRGKNTGWKNDWTGKIRSHMYGRGVNGRVWPVTRATKLVAIGCGKGWPSSAPPVETSSEIYSQVDIRHSV